MSCRISLLPLESRKTKKLKNVDAIANVIEITETTELAKEKHAIITHLRYQSIATILGSEENKGKRKIKGISSLQVFSQFKQQ